MIALAMEMIEEQLHLLQNVKILLNKGENKKSKENGEPKGVVAPNGDMKVEVLPTPSSAKVDNLLLWAFDPTHLLIQSLLLLHFKIPQIILKLYGSKS